MTTQQLEVHVEQVRERRIAAIRCRADGLGDLPGIIMLALNEVWPFLRQHEVATGSNIVVYRDVLEAIDIGVEIFDDLPAHDRIVASTTPAGRAATVAYFGAYEDLPEAHAAIQDWSRGTTETFVPPCWELYGDWADDPSERRTDVYYLLQENA